MTHAQMPIQSPITDYLSTAPRPGVSTDGRYLVVPRIVLDQMPPQLQSEFTQLLTTLHIVAAQFPWPVAYRVDAAEYRPVAELGERDLEDLGVSAEYNTDGDLNFYDTAAGPRLTASDLERQVPVACADPLYAHLDQQRTRQ